MSSSPSRAPVPPARIASATGEALEVLSFPYSEVAGTGPGKVRGGRLDRSTLAAGLERETQLRESGRQQGILDCRARFEEQLAGERAAVGKAVADFARERADYYQKIEAEAVRLALRIARQILHREAQVDPSLLMGIVRVALGKIEGATGVALLVPSQQAADWRKYLAMRMDPADLPEIVEDPAMAPEQCGLRTSMGTAELGLEVQLKEIEQGLMDLLAARPQSGGQGQP